MKKNIIQLIQDLFSPDKKLWRFYLLFFVAALMIFNWNKLYWIFDQRAVSGVIESKIVSKAEDNPVSDTPTEDVPVVTENRPTLASSIVPKEKPVVSVKSDKPQGNRIYIPALKVQAPILRSSGATNAEYLAVLKKGVLHYSNSAMPNELGAMIVLGHSAPPNWPNINYDDIFSEISALKAGDEIKVSYQGKSYTYLVESGRVIDKGGDIPEEWLKNDEKRIILLSCWPPGKDYKRYGVVANLLTEE